MTTDEKEESAYNKFDGFLSRYGIKLGHSDKMKLIDAVDTLNEELKEAWRIVCDVEGCDFTASAQGMYWKPEYWCLCSDHATFARNGNERPPMKSEAIEREERRKLHPDRYVTR